MMDSFDIIDDIDCGGDCFKCPYAIYKEIGGIGGDTYPVACKLDSERGE